VVKQLFPSCSPKRAKLLTISFEISEGSGRAVLILIKEDEDSLAWHLSG
jgi:hypothetical protein